MTLEGKVGRQAVDQEPDGSKSAVVHLESVLDSWRLTAMLLKSRMGSRQRLAAD